MKQGEPVPEVKVGQVWEAYERRMVWVTHTQLSPGGYEVRTMSRTMQVLELLDHGQFGAKEPGARCHVVETGRKVIVALRRMKPGTTRGYRLVSEGDADGAL